MVKTPQNLAKDSKHEWKFDPRFLLRKLKKYFCRNIFSDEQFRVFKLHLSSFSDISKVTLNIFDDPPWGILLSFQEGLFSINIFFIFPILTEYICTENCINFKLAISNNNHCESLKCRKKYTFINNSETKKRL